MPKRMLGTCIAVNLTCILLGGCGELICRGVIDARIGINKCPVHDTALQEDTVWIQYGFPVMSEEYTKAERELFPYANSCYLGGCVVKTEKCALVKYCTKCRQAKKDWEKAHGKMGIK